MKARFWRLNNGYILFCVIGFDSTNSSASFCARGLRANIESNNIFYSAFCYHKITRTGKQKMSVSITAKLNKAANEFQAGESIGFGLRLGQQYYDRETKQREWTNYECVIFAKQQSQIDFYRQMLVEGAIVAVSGKEQKIRSFDGNNGTILSIEIMNASLDNVFGSAVAPQDQPQQQQAPAQPAAQPQSFGSFDTDWSGYKPSATTNGATLDQVKKKYNGDLQAAIKNGHVEVDDDSSIPF